MNDTTREDEGPGNFIRDIVEADLREGRRASVVTRFPPEPNGYLHIGHAKAIWVNFSLAEMFGGRCNLRFDDTNPVAEDEEYVHGIERDIRWLGFEWGETLYASDYFEQLYTWAVQLVKAGKAYVDTQSLEAIREGRGNFHRPGVESPDRDRSVEENLALFEKMRAGELEEGSAVLRAKIDMQSTDVKLRDPLMYRILKTPHHRTGDAWHIYPMYDWAHGQSDAIEGITHSCCSLEFVNHHGLYDWFLEAIGLEGPPQQYEFARLAIDYTITSKRALLQLVNERHVDGWDDPRMPTLTGMRRRGYTPEAIRAFCERTGVSRRPGVVDVGMLEHAIREDLNERSPRLMGVLDPIRVVIENYPEDQVDWFDCPLNPTDDSFGTRRVPFSRELFIEREDFAKQAHKKWFRLAPGAEVRLRYAALITCNEAIEDEHGEVVELRCTWDPASKGGKSPDGRKVKGTLHWVSAAHAVDAEVRLFDRLFTVENPMGDESKSFLEFINPDSKKIVTGKLEPALGELEPGTRVQLERVGYFVTDSADHTAERPVFNRTITLKDTWAKIAARG
ncbi:MAG: glutamine--tRNA ligase/YqeY domain fusion protein [Sandaracinaceae bacterium]|nr:glutamine--tRNA ligase/YqeY domain fusion protein [Sandaracinaceae bacterium]